MQTKGRALFNLIAMNWQEDKSLPVEQWQVEDYRLLETKELFHRLENLGISLDEERFVSFSDESLSPEELTDTLWVEEHFERYDEAYLLIFELWRRLLPEKQSLSIFCNELDRLIDLYDSDQLETDEPIYEALTDLEKILDEHVDNGEEPEKVFEEVSLYCAHDIESFIYDLAAHEIDKDESLKASELVDGFSPYITDRKWFEFLKLRLLAASDSEEAEPMLARILEDQEENPDFELLLEIARFLISRGDSAQFFSVIYEMKNLIETEQDFQELLALTSEYYRLQDREQEGERIAAILSKRQGKPLDQQVQSTDKDCKAFFVLIDDFDRSEA